MIKRHSLNIKTASQMLPERSQFSHKGSFGKVLLICGSRNLVGCCCLAAEGALRSGAGIVSLAFPDCLYPALTSRLTENLFVPLKTDEHGFICEENINHIVCLCNQSDCVMLGCGIGVSPGTKKLVKEVVLNCEKPLILDADALNCLSEFNETLLNKKSEILLTPHPAEMARLCGLSVADIEQNREAVALEFCKTYGVNLLLKGNRTIICNSHANELYINTTGNTGLSKGGAGDLLSGIIAGLTPSMKGQLFASAALGAFVHGMSADVLKETFSEYSILPTDCAAILGRVYRIIENEGL